MIPILSLSVCLSASLSLSLFLSLPLPLSLALTFAFRCQCESSVEQQLEINNSRVCAVRVPKEVIPGGQREDPSLLHVETFPTAVSLPQR